MLHLQLVQRVLHRRLDHFARAGQVEHVMRPEHVLVGGKVVEEGKHEALVAKGGVYAQMVRGQSVA